MMQPQWPGLGPSFDFSALESPLGGDSNVAATGAFPRTQPPDGLTRPWWMSGTATGNAGGNGGALSSLFGGASASNGSIAGILTGLVTLLQQLVGTFLNQNQAVPSQQQPCTSTGRQQRFENVDVSSTGDPHLAAVGTREGPGGGSAVDAHWDSMTSQNDLVHSTQIDGGYRVSTAVTQPGANGVTWNQSATVHANFDQDAVMMNRDGSFAIFDNGSEVRLGKGESATLSGGETVSENQDGSLLVSARSATGGTIATTLRSTGQGVDVTTHAHELAVGGDAIAHAGPTAPARHAAHVPPLAM
ncbi:MAG: hypothetical protein M3N49_14545 [Candidatus Eremiobacteraeota bacterium]|nr:hypothetical protein [Candidatus Eremiobacteraeota bacterium]